MSLNRPCQLEIGLVRDVETHDRMRESLVGQDVFVLKDDSTRRRDPTNDRNESW